MNEGLVLKPDAVLVTFFIGNDFQDEKSARKWYTYSYVASFVNYLFDVRRKYRRSVVEPTTVASYYDDHPSVSDEAYLALEKRRSEIYKHSNDHFVIEHEKATRYVIEMKTICDERNIQLLVVIAPDEVQVNRQLQSRVVESFGASPNDFDFSLPNKLLGAKLSEHKIDYVDLLDDFLAASAQKALYKPNDSHWNIEGNRLAAETIQRNLFRSSSVPDAHVPISQPRLSRKRS